MSFAATVAPERMHDEAHPRVVKYNPVTTIVDSTTEGMLEANIGIACTDFIVGKRTFAAIPAIGASITIGI
jgi:hypothetical protein